MFSMMTRKNWSPLLIALLLVLPLTTGAASSSSTGDVFGMQAALGIGGAQGASPNEVSDERDAVFKDSVVPAVTPKGFDYGQIPETDVFGSRLFSGAFAHQGAVSFNPDYVVAIGDRLHVRLWGAVSFDGTVTVDPEGNIFLPNVGPIRVLGVRSRDLQGVIKAAVRRVYQKNVLSYANLEAAQPVRVFVSGFVRRPGLYEGTGMSSLLHYLDQAGGIDPERGSYLDVQIKRGKKIRHHINLYDFLLKGAMPLVQFADGDVIFVPPRKKTVKVSGLVKNANQFEFDGRLMLLSQLVKLAEPDARATHVRIVRNTGTVRNVEYYSLALTPDVRLSDGDEVEFVADKKPGTITVRVEGEHDSAQEYVLPYGSRLGDLLKQIRFTENADTKSLQLFRRSIKERQAAALRSTLKQLENAVLTARSGTNDEARLRKDEASLILQWVERAKNIEPLGQVVITGQADAGQLLLENGDIVRVPTRDGLVVVNGEVLFPTAIAYSDKYSLHHYIKAAGGYSQNADSSRVILAHRDGTFEEVDGSNIFSLGGDQTVREGDEILVLPRIDVKTRQIAKDLTQVLYQIAVSAKVVLGL